MASTNLRRIAAVGTMAAAGLGAVSGTALATQGSTPPPPPPGQQHGNDHRGPDHRGPDRHWGPGPRDCHVETTVKWERGHWVPGHWVPPHWVPGHWDHGHWVHGYRARGHWEEGHYVRGHKVVKREVICDVFGPWHRPDHGPRH